MTTIQDRIIKDFRKTFLNIRFDTTVGTGVNLEQFLIKSIKEVEEETRKEIIARGIDCFNHINSTAFNKGKNWSKGFDDGLECGKDILLKVVGLSITNKEKQK